MNNFTLHKREDNKNTNLLHCYIGEGTNNTALNNHITVSNKIPYLSNDRKQIKQHCYKKMENYVRANQNSSKINHFGLLYDSRNKTTTIKSMNYVKLECFCLTEV